MKEESIFREPYSDNMMEWDAATGRYYLTEEAMRAAGCELRANLSETLSASPDIVIKGFLRRATQQIYGFIHRHNVDTEIQDYLLSHVPFLRGILMEALILQATYNYISGDLSFSADKNEREMKIQGDVEDTLNTIIPVIGRTILFCGNWRSVILWQ